MKKILLVSLICLFAWNAEAGFSTFISSCVASNEQPLKQNIEVYFSPNGGCTEAIVKEIANAKKNIKIQAYGFTSEPIAKALLEAKERNVGIDIILDKCNESEKYSIANLLENHGIIVMIDRKPAIAHSKIMIIDSETLITGSFNFTKAAEERNTENLLIVKNNQDIVNQYLKNFENREKVSNFFKDR